MTGELEKGRGLHRLRDSNSTHSPCRLSRVRNDRRAPFRCCRGAGGSDPCPRGTPKSMVTHAPSSAIFLHSAAFCNATDKWTERKRHIGYVVCLTWGRVRRVAAETESSDTVPAVFGCIGRQGGQDGFDCQGDTKDSAIKRTRPITRGQEE